MPRGRSPPDWAGTIRRWTQDYDVLTTNSAASYLQPPRLDALNDRLHAATGRYAVTGSLAAGAIAPIAPARLAMVYVGDPSNAADALDLRSVDAGANTILLQPYDEVVFERLSTVTTSQSSTPHNLRSTC